MLVKLRDLLFAVFKAFVAVLDAVFAVLFKLLHDVLDVTVDTIAVSVIFCSALDIRLCRLDMLLSLLDVYEVNVLLVTHASMLLCNCVRDDCCELIVVLIVLICPCTSCGFALHTVGVEPVSNFTFPTVVK